MLTRKYFPALQNTEILRENPVSETINHKLVHMSPSQETLLFGLDTNLRALPQ